MPRIAEARQPAAPSSPDQKDRYERILRAATVLGAESGIDRMQMQDVAKAAGVAIATLYRYFPSKTHLFTAVMKSQVDRLDAQSTGPKRGQLPSEAVAEMLVNATRVLLQRPLLAMAMMQSNNAAHAATVTDAGRIDNAFRDLIVSTAGIANPTLDDLRLVRILEQTWYGALMSNLNGRTSLVDAEGDIVTACELLLAHLSVS